MTTNSAAPKRGRPPTLTDGKRVTLTLDQATIDRARELGAGNLSLGVRRALEPNSHIPANPEAIT